MRDPAPLLRDWHDGRIKQFVIARILQLRAASPQLFAAGDYSGIEPEGGESARIVAFRRNLPDGSGMLVVVPRLCSALVSNGGSMTVSPAAFEEMRLPLNGLPESAVVTDAFSTRKVPIEREGFIKVDALLGTLPVALLSWKAPGQP